MANNVLAIMNARYVFLLQLKESLEKKHACYPVGSINVKPNKSGYSYIWHRDKTFEYLGKNNTDLSRQLVQKDHITSAIKVADKEIHALRSIIDEYPKEVIEDLYNNLPENRKKYATPIFLDNDHYARNWLSTPFTPKPFKKDAPVFRTLKGERVRSKSEVIIADRLYAKGIPYKYECPLQVGDEIIHPDFTILRLSDRKTVYHEHCGKMDDPDYTEDLVSRVKKYGRAGIYPGNGLSFSFESSKQPLDINWLDDFIEKNFR